ncbi:NB-ARC domain-containing protein [Aerosakkonemataceae cyanobacterium BLCC-F154]|uniref:NB-ARC domain-containing protein n=1 Tax=Floridaenema fluviatile BLCC-F154 TaxID=3153640 RepID=A0ABV4YDC9_9CYAN
MPTLKVSQIGLTRIKQARKEKGWTIYDFRWLQEASKVLNPSWCEDDVLSEGISEGTWKRFLAGKPIKTNTFKAFCQVLGVDWYQVVERNTQQDWGGAPDVSIFYHRRDEVAEIERSILQEQCRLVLLFGMGGIGKTFVATKVAKKLQNNFEFVIWRSLRNVPTLAELLTDLRQVLTKKLVANPTIKELLEYLTNFRCLLVLDNFESILQSGDRTGKYLEEYENYAQLIQAVAETPHNSCLILTSREKLKTLAAKEGEKLPVRSLQITGLPTAEARKIFFNKGDFTGSEAEWKQLISRYGGNPLALEIVATSIKDHFASNISNFQEFINTEPFIFDDIRDLLAKQFNRLSNREKEIMYWLAIKHQPVSLPELQSSSLSYLSPCELLESLAALQRRSLIEKNDAYFSLQPVVMEFITTRIIDGIAEDVFSEKLAIGNFDRQSVRNN